MPKDNEDELQYNEISMDPLELLFEKIHEARGGEILLIHVPDGVSPGEPDIRCLAAVNDDSILLDILPDLINELIDERT